MGLQQVCEQYGITLEHGALYSPDVVRDITRKLRPDYVRHTGIESIRDAEAFSASGRNSDLSFRIPSSLAQRSPTGSEVRLELCFSETAPSGFGVLSFRYDSSTHSSGYRFDNYSGANDLPHPEKPLL